ncbi:MAG TPA: alpha/beta fold hydrolase [Actinomycetes bacterium]|nr:alpha/beta fold hydrolase [Actinomycetes bacterium]
MRVRGRVLDAVTGAVTLPVAVPRAVMSADVATAVRSTVVEAAWLGAHVLLYPLNTRRERASMEAPPLSVSGLSLVQRSLYVSDVEAAGTPIVLVHGIVDNRSIFTLLRRALRRRGFRHVHNFEYGVLATDLRAVAEELGTYVEQVCEERGAEQVHLIGHSLGGIVARYYVQRLGGDKRVHTVVTLGSPHGGTLPARLVPHPLLRSLRPGSDIIKELAQPAPGIRTRFVCFWSDHDPIVVPRASARLEHPDLEAKNVLVRGVGHSSLLVDGRVVRELVSTLAELSPRPAAPPAETPRAPARAPQLPPRARPRAAPSS